MWTVQLLTTLMKGWERGSRWRCMMGWGAFNIDAGEWVRALQVWVHDGVEQGRAGGVAEIAASMVGGARHSHAAGESKLLLTSTQETCLTRFLIPPMDPV